MATHRCIKNPYPSFDEETKLNKEEIIEKLMDQIALNMKDIKKNYPAKRTTKLYSNGKKRIDSSMYTGTGGNVYLYYKLIQFAKHCKKDTWVDNYNQDFKDALKANIAIITECINKGNKDKSPSFLMSDNGVYTIAALYYHYLADEASAEDKRDQFISFVLDSVERCYDEMYAEDEILYGNSGYLYCLLILHDILPDDSEFKKKIVKAMDKVAVDVYKIGKKRGKDQGILIYKWPRSDGELYLGGAHGLIDVQLFQKVKILNNDAISTLDHLISIQCESGNFPSCLGEDDDKLLHFCHGAPGAIPLMLLAYQMFDDDAYLESACKAGDIIWSKGLLLKGFGICHGISGNTLVLNSLYRATKDPKWEYCAYKFAESTTDPDIKEKVGSYNDRARYEIGLPDTPYSLMEGLGGHTIMLIDMCIDEDSDIPGYYGQRFPAYEI